MLRLPKFQVALPESVADAVALLSAHEGEAMIVAGGTDLLPNLKHRLFEPKLLVSLERGQGSAPSNAKPTARSASAPWRGWISSQRTPTSSPTRPLWHKPPAWCPGRSSGAWAPRAAT